MTLIQPPLYYWSIPLRVWVEYEIKYGIELDKKLDSISRYQDIEEAYQQYQVELYEKTYSHYTDTPLEEVKQIPLSELIPLMGNLFLSWKEQETRVRWDKILKWKGEQYTIRPIEVKNHNNLTEKELDYITDYALCVSDMQDGNVESIYELCAILLRKPHESYTTELKDTRKELFRDLPLNHAKSVMFYWKYSIDKMKELKMI